MGRLIRGIRALIFDMDGIIVDSEPLHLLAYQEFFRTHAIEFSEEENRQFLGNKDLEMAKVLVERYSLPLSAEELVLKKEQILKRLLNEHAKPRPGLNKTLQTAAELGLSMAVASSATLPSIELIVSILNIRHYFHNLSSGDEVAAGKPAPDVFLLAARRLGVVPKHCLVLEDTLNGIKAALSAGMYCIAIACDATRHQDHFLADLQLSTMEDLDLRTLVEESATRAARF